MTGSTQAPTSISVKLSSQLLQDYIYEKTPEGLANTGDMVEVGGGVVLVDGARLRYYAPDQTSQSGWNATDLPVVTPPTAASSDIVKIKAFSLPGENGPTHNIICFYPTAGSGFAVSALTRATDKSWGPTKLTFAAASLLSQVADVDVIDAGAGVGLYLYGTTMPIMGQNNAQLFILCFGDYTKLDTASWDVTSQTSISSFWATGSGGQMDMVAGSPGTNPKFRFVATGDGSGPRDLALVWWDTLSANTLYSILNVTQANGRLNWTPTVFPPQSYAPLTSYSLADGEMIEDIVPILQPRPQDNLFWTAMVRGANSIRLLQVPKGAYTPFVETNLTKTPTANTLGAVQSAKLSTAWDGSVSILAVIANTLWLLRGLDKAFFNLGNPAVATGISTANPNQLSLFYAASFKDAQTGTAEYKLFHMSEDADKSAWLTFPIGILEPDLEGIARGAVDPSTVASIAIDVAVVDQAGNPVVQIDNPQSPSPWAVSMTLNADQWGVYVVDDRSFWVGPGQSATFPVDGLGRASIRHRAHSLQFAKVEIIASLAPIAPAQGQTLTASASCQGDFVDPRAANLSATEAGTPSTTTVAARLANKDPAHPMDASPASQAALQNANLIPANMSSSDLTNMTNMLNSVGTWMQNHAPGAAAQGSSLRSPMAERQWTFTPRIDGPGFSCVETTGRELPTFSLSGLFNDIVNAAKNLAADVANAVVTVGEDGLHFVIKIGSETFKAIASTIKQAGDLVQTIFAIVKQGIEDAVAFIKEVVEFLMMLFEWDDIVRTHNVMRHLFNWFLRYGLYETKKLQGYVDDHLIGLISGDQVKYNQSQLDGMKLAQTPAQSASGSSVTLSDPSYKRHLDHQSSHCFYVYNRSKNHTNALNDRSRSAGGTTSSVLPGALNDAVGKWGYPKQPDDPHKPKQPDNTDLANSLRAAFDKIQIDSIFSTQTLQFFVDTFKDIVKAALVGLEDVVNAIVGALQTYIQDFIDALDTPLNIPVITWVYKTFFSGGNDLTILDLGCLIAAVPATILYKIIKQKAPISGDLETQIFKGFAYADAKTVNGTTTPGSASIDWTAFNASSAVMLGGAPTAVQIVAEVLGIVSGVVNLIAGQFAYWSDGLTIVAACADVEVKNFLGWICWFFSVIALALSVPLTMFFTYTDTLASNICYTIYYGLEWAPLAVDLIALWDSESRLVDWAVVGPLAEGFFGDAIVYAGVAFIIACCVEKKATENAWNFANILVSSLPRPLRATIPSVAGGDLVTLAIVLALVLGGDVLGQYAGTATQIGSSVS